MSRTGLYNIVILRDRRIRQESRRQAAGRTEKEPAAQISFDLIELAHRF